MTYGRFIKFLFKEETGAIGRSVRCEECGIEKGEGNRWFELRWTPTRAPYFLEWTREAEQPETHHICGETCAHTVLSKYLTTRREIATETVAT